MAKSLIRGGTVKSLSDLKRSLKKGGGGSSFLQRIPSEDSLMVRFLEDPVDHWVDYMEHYDEERNFYPCIGKKNDCVGCGTGASLSQRYLCNAVNTADSKVIPLVMPKSLAKQVLAKYEKFSTLLDRDYELSRTGTGFDTEYDAEPQSPTKMKLSRYEPLDLWAILEDAMADAHGNGDDEDDDDAPTPKGGTKRGGSKRPPVADDDDDEGDDDEDEQPRRSVKKKSMTLGKPRKVAAKKKSLSRR